MGASAVGERASSWGFGRVVAVVAGAFFLLPGIWALAAPESFFERAATFDPYNQHFVQDLGAFQIGLGAVVLLAAARPLADVLAVTLLGVGVGAAAHVASHVVGHDLGGSPGIDIPVFAVVAVLLLVAGVVRWREKHRPPPQGSSPR